MLNIWACGIVVLVVLFILLLSYYEIPSRDKIRDRHYIIEKKTQPLKLYNGRIYPTDFDFLNCHKKKSILKRLMNYIKGMRDRR